MKQLLICLLIVLQTALFAQTERTVPAKRPGKRGHDPSLIRGPYLQSASSTEITIRWRTDGLARSRVNYGTDPQKLNQSVRDNELVTEHIIRLTELKPETRYYYSIGGIIDTLQGDTSNYFYTLPQPGSEGKYRIGIFGDCGTNQKRQWDAKKEFLKYLGDDYLTAWILLGDNAYPDGTDAEYQMNFFNVYKDDLLKKSPLFPAPGNHDYHDREYSAAEAQNSHQVAYYQNFTMPVNGESGGVPSHNKSYYSFDIGNIHFLSLDSYGKENEARLYDTLGPQVQWVKKDLAANKNKGWVVAYWHHPPYTMGTHNSDKETELVKIRENFIRILERNGVDLILCGHSHVYERSKLMSGYYGFEADFDPKKYNKSNSTGLYNGSADSCPYIKNTGGEGVVYVVSGSAGKIGKTKDSFPHEAMYFSNGDIAGASILEVEGNRLDLKWICSDGQIRDSFTMMKDVNKKTIVKAKKGRLVTLTASYNGEYNWSTGERSQKSIQVKPAAGTTKYFVKDQYNCIRDSFEVRAD